MAIVLENSSLADWRHWDNWLRDRQRTGAQPEFKCFEPLGGYNHRTSGTYKGGERFGGAWLPGCDDPETKQDTEAYLLSNAPRLVRDWVQECKTVDSEIKRGDRVPCPLAGEFPYPSRGKIEGGQKERCSSVHRATSKELRSSAESSPYPNYGACAAVGRV